MWTQFYTKSGCLSHLIIHPECALVSGGGEMACLALVVSSFAFLWYLFVTATDRWWFSYYFRFPEVSLKVLMEQVVLVSYLTSLLDTLQGSAPGVAADDPVWIWWGIFWQWTRWVSLKVLVEQVVLVSYLASLLDTLQGALGVAAVEQ